MSKHTIQVLKERLSRLEAEIQSVREAIRKEGGATVDKEGIGAQQPVPDPSILDNATDGIFTLDSRGRVTYINKAGARLLGRANAPELGWDFTADLGRWFKMRDSMDGDSGVAEWITAQEAGPNRMVVDFALDVEFGGLRWLNLQLHRVGQEAHHRVSIQGVVRDITEQHRLQQVIRLSEEHYRGIIENMDLGILEVDNEERITRAFPKFCAIVGYGENELLGLKASDVFISEEDRHKMDTRTQERNAGESGLYECPIRTKDGSEKWLLISGVPIRNENGRVVGSMGIHYDITERKRDEQQLSLAMEEIQKARWAERAFLAKMSHEIRTPMNAILGMARVLGDTALNSEQRRFLEAITQGGNLLKGLLDDALDLARLDEGEYSLNKRPAVVRSVFESVVAVYRTLFEEKGVSLNLHAEGPLGRTMVFDRSILSQILINLVGNAVKFTHQGEVNLRAALSATEGRWWLDVAVEDTGSGMAPELLPLIFDRYEQGDMAGDGVTKGSGLGLAIVKELCALHGGHVEVDSTLGVGSVFRFRVALEEHDGAEDGRQLFDAAQLEGQHFIVAEDNEINMLLLTHMLAQWGVRYTCATDGDQAVDAWRAGGCDLILMDVQMPGCGGCTATRRIRQEEGEGLRTPIVGLSAFAFEADVLDALASGMDAYVKKPFTPEELLAAIGACQAP